MSGSSKWRSRFESGDGSDRRRWDCPSKVTRAFSAVQEIFWEEKRERMVSVLRGIL